MSTAQPGILLDVPPHARFLTFRLAPGADPRGALAALAAVPLTDGRIVGLGDVLVHALGATIPGLRPFPALTGVGVAAPSTPTALWVRLAGADPGALFHEGAALEAALAPSFVLDGVTESYRHGSGRDLTGYEDGTENPKGDAALAAALVSGQGPGYDGASFLATQQWVHDWRAFRAMRPGEQDAAVGRRISDNAEIEDAPPSAHVRRTAQESFSPPAFVVRRSMPWHDRHDSGLVFLAFAATLDAFEAQLRRMIGLDDGVVDALYGFTRPVTGAYLWCPPVRADRLDLRAVGIG
ncbi:MAG: Dyp-type peroxidase [Pseudomonadota bacterium]|nr:Dyp-type peroxidase [Pseudomonadota bacterium]